MLEAARTNYGMVAHETASADEVTSRLADAADGTVAAEVTTGPRCS